MTELKKKVAFKTLGCRLNQFETSSMATHFRKSGYELVRFNENADVYIVNTCTVTNQSDHKSRNIIRQAVKKGNNPLIVVTGCMAESGKEKLLLDNDISYVIGNNNKSQVLSVINAHFNGEIFSYDTSERKVFDFDISEKIFKTRGMVKIQDGCNNFCTFCIIPFVRGREISRPLSDILEETKKLVTGGYNEIVVTGVNIGRYKYENYTFEDVIEKILEIDGVFRVRISSMEPEGIGEKFIDLISHPKLCPHLHLCLQSGSNNILLKMRRMYNKKQYIKLIERIRGINPLFNFTTDILVGFPGETEDDFKETYDLINEIGFGHVHTFKYSLRDGTKAALMTDQVPEKIKNERSRVIRELSEMNKVKYRKQFINKDQTVLIEKKGNDGYLKGYGEYYIPVILEGNKNLTDSFQKVRILELKNDNEKNLLANFIK